MSPPTRLSPKDPSSFSRPEQVIVKHAHLDWRVNFTHKTITAQCELTIEKIDKTAQTLILDTRDIEITSVKVSETGASLNYVLADAIPNFGAELKITLPADENDKWKILIDYRTLPVCSALQWLCPEQTAGKVHPYLFSQCQPIHCRSFLPCQDTPGVKMSYSATVTVPKGLVALMSALREGQEEKDDETIFKFNQPVPIPSYLLALAVGALESRSIGPRSLVWSEKEYVDKAAWEFSETETMIATAESICGPYIWKQYDLLVLPPSFPYGGMENPCLTFITPTVLAGDKSLVDVVAHEITHSWTGNLVTNCQWEHFWLNEGFTMFVERKIIGKMHGEAARHFSAIGGWKQLFDCIKSRGATDPLTCLIPDLSGIDPDDAFSSVPYEKGHSLLWHLEKVVGGAEAFEPFLKSYLEEFKHKSIDSDTFKDYLYKYFHNKTEELNEVDWRSWWHTPGMPPIELGFDQSKAEVCTALCKRWVEWDVNTDCPFVNKDLEPFSSNQIIVWLSQLLEEPILSLEKLQKMDEVYKMSDYTNSEIKFRWLRLCIKGKCKEKVKPALEFVTVQGRMKFVRPIYRDLYEWEYSRKEAIENFEANKKYMMHVASYVVAKDLHLV